MRRLPVVAALAGLAAAAVAAPATAPAEPTQSQPVFTQKLLYDPSLRINGTTVSVLEPKWSKGNDLCCPSKLRERDYAFDAKALTFKRTGDKTIPFATN